MVMYSYSLLDLPVELLVFVISFLNARDVAILRQVSKSLHVFTEVPLLWRKFEWPYYHSREEASVIEILKLFGDYVKELSFTNDYILLPMQCCDQMLVYCTNVICLTLLINNPLTKGELKKILQNLKHLKKLEISWSRTRLPAATLSNSNLTELTLQLGSKVFPSIDEYESWIQDYMSTGYTPQYLNIVQNKVNLQWLAFRYLLKWWSYHSMRNQYKPPNGYIAHLKLYCQYQVPLNLSPTLPQFHIQFGLAPSVKVNRFKYYNVLGQGYYSLKLNYCNCTDLNCNCIVISASVDKSTVCFSDAAHHRQAGQHEVIKIKDSFDISNYVIDVSVSNIYSMLDKGLDQLHYVIPNLKELDLSYYDICVDKMKGFQTVAKNCCNLVGLNLINTHAELLDLAVFWEILSGLKLIRLSIEYCLITSADSNIQLKMVNLYSTLAALEIGFSICSECENSSSEDLLCLSNFSSLKYCRVHHHDAFHSTIVHNIATSCKQLKCLIVQPNSFYDQSPFHPTGISLSSSCNNNLEQLFIDSEYTVVSNEFMETVSAHGGLRHFVLQVAAVTEEGVNVLVENSPKLVQLHISLCVSVNEENGGLDPSAVDSFLRKRYNYRRLFTAGYFKMKFNESVGRFFFMYHYLNNAQNTVFFPLW